MLGAQVEDMKAPFDRTLALASPLSLPVRMRWLGPLSRGKRMVLHGIKPSVPQPDAFGDPLPHIGTNIRFTWRELQTIAYTPFRR